jgi:hypothetical protein
MSRLTFMAMIQLDTSGTLHDCRVAVLVKALPQPSQKHGETVCCAGVTADGRWKRLYPVRFRHLSGETAFKRWHWVDYRYSRPPKDPRVESCRVHEESIAIGGELPKAGRSRFLNPVIVPSTRVATERGQSLALIRPTNTRFYWREKSKADLASEMQRIQDYNRQTSLFDKELPPFDPTPYEFRFTFQDAEGKEHDCENGDWEAHAMYWRWSKEYGSARALGMMGEKFNDEYPKRGMAFAQGTLFKRPNIWTLLGVIRLDPYAQTDLF